MKRASVVEALVCAAANGMEAVTAQAGTVHVVEVLEAALIVAHRFAHGASTRDLSPADRMQVEKVLTEGIQRLQLGLLHRRSRRH